MSDNDKRGVKKTSRTPKKGTAKQTKSKRKTDKEVLAMNEDNEHSLFKTIDDSDTLEFEQRTYFFNFMVDQLLFRDQRVVEEVKENKNGMELEGM